MKKILILVIVALCSCENVNHPPVIKSKYLLQDRCMCEFYYDGLNIRGQNFHDSCAKYNIGDTIN
jgi:hypothetical protein